MILKKENYAFDIDIKILERLCQLSEKYHVSVDLLIEEALTDIVKKYKGSSLN